MVNRRATPDDPSVLLAQAGWVQVLARRLVAEPAGAEDVAQETLLRALQYSPDGGRNETSLRAWLGSVARNLARSRGRSEGHRLLREERAAQSESTPSTAEVVVRADTLRQVVEAVLALDEPARSTVLWTYFDGESAVEIARRTGASPAAVRKRLSRALAILRVALDGSHGGDGRSWCTALLSLTGGAAQSARMTGAMAMGTQAKVVAAVITLGLGGMLWRMSGPTKSSAPPAVAPVAEAATTEESGRVQAHTEDLPVVTVPSRTDASRESVWGRLRVVHSGSYERLSGV
ncbi:MAG: sigma-70 family RNA polymerase sigma factor, partial [Planctomycetota bacterium]